MGLSVQFGTDVHFLGVAWSVYQAKIQKQMCDVPANLNEPKALGGIKVQKPDSLNPTLTQIHKLFATAYLFFLIPAVIGLFDIESGGDTGYIPLFFGLAAIGVVHVFGYVGTKRGKGYGREISRAFGLIWLLGFPIGTIIGYQILKQTSDKYWNGCAVKPLLDNITKSSIIVAIDADRKNQTTRDYPTEQTKNELNARTKATCGQRVRNIQLRLNQFTGSQRLFVAISVIWLLITIFIGYKSYEHQRNSVIIGNNVTPVIVMKNSMNYLERMELVGNVKLDVEKLGYSPSTKKTYAFVENQWTLLVKREHLSGVAIKVAEKTAILWAAPLLALYLIYSISSVRLTYKSMRQS